MHNAMRQQRFGLEQWAKRVLVSNQDYEQLISLSAISPTIALVSLAEVSDTPHFAHHGQFLKYCGHDFVKLQFKA